ncbi:MAG: adenylyltransferase/cytidyltransferase family protein [Candidatus Krumholzibacteria bacterium]|nr:adenylyltransferase/cytidyltransferase family protein [Candidatus Krumholzibacteria bacterium]
MKCEGAPIFGDTAAVRALAQARGAARVVLANGCFDPLHVGHVRYLTGAAACGDFLVVALNDDASTHRLKGAGRPVIAEGDRARLLAALAVVDAVLVFSEDDVTGILEALRPAVHAKGTDYTVDGVPEVDTSRRLGVETVIVGDPKTHASREVLARVRGRG